MEEGKLEPVLVHARTVSRTSPERERKATGARRRLDKSARNAVDGPVWLPALLLALASATPALACCGDCAFDGAVTIDEAVRAVVESLDGCDGPCCADCGADGAVSVGDVVRVVDASLHGCPDCAAPGSDCTLREAARQAGVGIGSAVDDLFERDSRYPSALVRNFDSITAENVLKWRATQPERGVFRFDRADELVEFAEAHSMRVRGHTLVWEQQLLDATPEYVTDVTDPEDLRRLMASHIRTVVGRYRGRIDTWDVVNEPLQTGGSELYDNVFHRLLGPGYVAEALELAHEADPDALLFINEVLVSNAGAKFDALLALAESLLGQRAPLHGVGLQGHFFGAPNGDELRANIEKLAALGLVVELTEVDVVLRGQDDLEARLDRQRQDYFDVVGACLAVEACRRVTFWGFTDRYTWIDGFLGPGFAPLLLDEEFNPKPAYFGVRDALVSATATVAPEVTKTPTPTVTPRSDRCGNDDDCDFAFEQCLAPGEFGGCGICYGDDDIAERYVVCSSDAQCDNESGQICAELGRSSGTCSPCSGPVSVCMPGCAGDESCGEAEACAGTHRCVGVPCSDDQECPTSFECADPAREGEPRRCRRRSCTSDDECGDAFCVKGACHSEPGRCRPLPA